LWSLLEPPAGLSSDGNRIYRALIDPIHTVLTYRPDHARQGALNLLEAWRGRLRQSEQGAEAVLQFLKGTWPKTWRTGRAILTAIAPITGALCSAVQFLQNPTPTRSGEEATAKSLRASVADKLSTFNAATWHDDLAAAVVADSAARQGEPLADRQGAQPGEANPPAVDEEDISILRYLGKRAPRLQTQQQIESGAQPHVARNTISNRLADLRAAGLACQPEGRRGGHTITPAGLAVLKRIDSDTLTR
jgi:hypothetical protein